MNDYEVDLQSSPPHFEQRNFIDLQNTCDGKNLRMMNEKPDMSCWSDSDHQERNSCVINNKNLFELEKSNDIGLKKDRSQSLKISQFEIDFRSTQNIISPKLVAESSIINKQDDSYYYLKSSGLQSYKDKKQSFSRSQSYYPKNMYGEKDQIRQPPVKSLARRQRSFNSMNLEGFDYNESKNRTFYERLKGKMLYFYYNNTLTGRTKILSKNIRRQIHDLSDYIPHNIHFNILKVIEKYTGIRIGRMRIPIMNPQTYIGFFIKVTLTLINCLFLFFFSLLLIFQFGSNESLIFIRIVWTLEIILNFNTALFQRSVIILNRKEIVLNYLKNRAFFDIFPLILVSMIGSNILPAFSIVIEILVLLKIFNIVTDLSYIQSQLCMMMQKYYFVQVFNLVCKMFLIGHFIACFWYLIAIIERSYFLNEDTWISQRLNENSQWWQLYISCLYWALTLMTTGSNAANTIIETCYTTFIMLFTTITFGYFLSAIGVILSEMDEKDQNKRRDITIINEYMRQKKTSKVLQSRVNLNLEYYYSKDFKRLKTDNEQVLDKISLELKNNLLREYNRKIINRIDIFAKKFSSHSLDELSLTVKEEYYFPNQIIFRSNEIGNTCILYVVSGQIELISESNLSEQSRVSIKSGQVCGLLQFFTGIPNNMSIISKEFTQVALIDREKFMNIIKYREKDFQEFYQLKDELNIYRQYDKINQTCRMCNQTSHEIINCHFLHVNKEYFLRKQGFEVTIAQNRRGYSRKKYRTQHTQMILSLDQQSQLQNHLKTLKNIDFVEKDYFEEEEEDEQEITEEDEQDFENPSSSSVYKNQELLSPDRLNGNNDLLTNKSSNALSQLKIARVLSSNYISQIEQDLTPTNLFEDKNIKRRKFSIQSALEQNENTLEGIRNNRFSDFNLQHINKISSEQAICIKRVTSELQNNKLDSNRQNPSQIEAIQSRQDLEEKRRKSNLHSQLDKEECFFCESHFKKRQLQKIEEIPQNKCINKYLEDFQTFLINNQKNKSKRKISIQQEFPNNNNNHTHLIKRNLHEDEHLFLDNPWIFESLKDYKYYFTKGNSYNVLKSMQRYRRKSRFVQKKSFRIKCLKSE